MHFRINYYAPKNFFLSKHCTICAKFLILVAFMQVSYNLNTVQTFVAFDFSEIDLNANGSASCAFEKLICWQLISWLNFLAIKIFSIKIFLQDCLIFVFKIFVCFTAFLTTKIKI